MQAEPPIVTITGRPYAMRKAAAEIRESLAVVRTNLNKYYTPRYTPGGLWLQCCTILEANLPVLVRITMKARFPTYQIL
jgi:hypothetical protein